MLHQFDKFITSAGMRLAQPIEFPPDAVELTE
jgi:hypothetical protein